MSVKNILFILSLLSSFIMAQEASEILDNMEKAMTQISSKGIMSQTIKTSTGSLRELEYEYYSGEKGKHTLMRYLKPSRSKGMAILMRDNSSQIWMYNQRTRRARMLASSAKNQNFENSDFTYEDMGGSDSWTDKYDATRLEDDKDGHYMLELKPKKSADVSYTKLIMQIRKSDNHPLSIAYFNDESDAFKTLYFDDIRIIEGVPTAFLLTMKNHRTGSNTIMKIISITYDVEFDDDFFFENNLRK
jgi:outer membrane lipoprotein-sorting protein